MTYSAGSADPGAQARATVMPTARAAILELWAAYQRLIELGWEPPQFRISCGQKFEAVIAGCQSPRSVVCAVEPAAWDPRIPNLMPVYPVFVDTEAQWPTDNVVLLVAPRRDPDGEGAAK